MTLLRDSEQRYRELFEANPDAVLMIDAMRRTICDANAAAARLYGRTHDELVGMSATQLAAPEPAPVVRDGILLRHDLRADGTKLPVEVTATTVERGGRTFVVEVIRDVSERERGA